MRAAIPHYGLGWWFRCAHHSNRQLDPFNAARDRTLVQ
jgi:hypothetical protein